MKYIAIDEMDHFQYHDTQIKTVEFRNSTLKFCLSAVNATTENSQNSFNEDMCIEHAEFELENAKIDSIVLAAYKTYTKTDHGLVLTEAEEEKAVEPQEYDIYLKMTHEEYAYIQEMDTLPSHDKETQCIRFMIRGSLKTYFLTLSFTKAIAKWNDFCGKAWYEDEQWKR